MRPRPLLRFDLFPFLGILSCLLAVLLLIVMSLVAFSVGPLAAEIWDIEGTSTKDPTLVEWNGIEIVIHPGKIKVPASLAFENEGVNDSEFGVLLKEIGEEKETRYIYLAVRPSGFHNFEYVYYIIDSKGIGIGYEPIEQNKPLGVKSGSEEDEEREDEMKDTSDQVPEGGE